MVFSKYLLLLREKGKAPGSHHTLLLALGHSHYAYQFLVINVNTRAQHLFSFTKYFYSLENNFLIEMLWSLKDFEMVSIL